MSDSSSLRNENNLSAINSTFLTYVQNRRQLNIIYNNSEITLNINEATPNKIKNEFRIQLGKLKLVREGVTYNEMTNNKFDPDLVRGTYTLTVIEVQRSNIYPSRIENQNVVGEAPRAQYNE